jgi:hypothetical protein
MYARENFSQEEAVLHHNPTAVRTCAGTTPVARPPE